MGVLKLYLLLVFGVTNEWLGHLNDHSKVLQEKILLKTSKM